MRVERYADLEGRVWLLAEHATSTPTIALAYSLNTWSGRLAMLEPLLSEIWVEHARATFNHLHLPVNVRRLSGVDYIGIAIETTLSGEVPFPEMIDAVVGENGPKFSDLVSLEDRRSAVRRIRESSTEIDSLRAFALAGHRYSYSVDDRIEVVFENDLVEAEQAFISARPLVVTVGIAMDSMRHLSPVAKSISPARAEPVKLIVRPDVPKMVQYRTEQELGRFTLLAPGPRFAVREKYDIHVAWLLLRSREGVLFPSLRAKGGLAYELAAFSREYVDGGYGMISARGDANSLGAIERVCLDGLEFLSKGMVDSSTIDRAIDWLLVAHHQAIRNPIVVVRSVISAELSGSRFEDYSAEILSVSSASLSASCSAFLKRELFLTFHATPRTSGG